MGDSSDFVIGKALEKALHGMKAQSGEDLWQAVPGEETYRLTISSTSMPYYVLQSDVLAYSEYERMQWLTRRTPKRWPKEKLVDMILEGKLRREK